MFESSTPSRVVVLYGGPWAEREVSIATAEQVIPALRDAALHLTPVRWDLDGWVILPDGAEDLRVEGDPLPPLDALGELSRNGLGVVFNALHGGPGEDGTIQGFLEIAGVPFTGAGVGGSALGFNKAAFRFAAQALGCRIARGMVVHREFMEDLDAILTDISTDVGLPAVVKPVAQGSSVGVRLVRDADELTDALEAGLARERRILVEEFIAGRELSIGVLGTRVGAPPQVLPIIEIEPLTDTGFFDYESKYEPGQANEIVPAPIEAPLEVDLCTQAALLHRELDLGGASRTDVIIGPDGPVFLETNTLPGLTTGSLLPQCAAAAGIDFTALCRRLIDYALSAHLMRGAESSLHGRD